MPAAADPIDAFAELTLRASGPLHSAMLTMTRVGAKRMPVAAAVQAVLLGSILSTAALAAAVEPEEGEEPDAILKLLHSELDLSWEAARRLKGCTHDA